ncbi:MAG: 1-acyl-sn-glycerol-3-phosphate acyltransferase [Clostridia bacterium]|nr:1-acyl-sn-glycerol-3-phosphate acyltransferase [Clostridia bacterium]
MKFKLPIDARTLVDVLPESLADYNAERELSHLRIRLEPSSEGAIRLREGRSGFIGSPVFEGAVTDSPEGGAVVCGEIVRRPAGTPRTWLRFWLFRTFILLSALSLTFLLLWGISALYGAERFILPSVGAGFVGACMLFAFARDLLFVRRRFARFFIAYLHAEPLADTPPYVRRRKRRVSRITRLRHRVVWALLSPPTRLYMFFRFGFRAPKCPPLPKGNFIMIANHTSDYDMIFMGLSVRRQAYFVMSEHALRGGFGPRMLRRYFDPIPRPKGRNAGNTVIEILRRAREGSNVAIFAEGFRTLSGYNSPFSDTTGAMVKKMGCTLITYRIKGGYYANPNWSTEIRRGKVWGEFAGVYPPEQISAMTAEEINGIIARDIWVDAAEVQAEAHVPYRCRRPAENIEFALFVCPVCHRLASITGRGDTFSCTCGATGRYTPYGELVSDSFPYHSIGDWYRWQIDYIEHLPDADPDTVFLRAEHQQLIEIDDTHHTDITIEQDAPFVLTASSLSVGAHVFSFSDVLFFDIIRHGYLLFTTREGRYYEVCGTVKFPGMLARQLYRRYTPACRQKDQK